VRQRRRTRRPRQARSASGRPDRLHRRPGITGSPGAVLAPQRDADLPRRGRRGLECTGPASSSPIGALRRRCGPCGTPTCGEACRPSCFRGVVVAATEGCSGPTGSPTSWPHAGPRPSCRGCRRTSWRRPPGRGTLVASPSVSWRSATRAHLVPAP
jgi:hypothetical protein